MEMGIIDKNWPMSSRDAEVQAWDSLTNQQKDEMDELMAITLDMAPHEWTTQGILGADMFVDSYTWFGVGNQPPEATSQEQLNNYLGSLASLLIK